MNLDKLFEDVIGAYEGYYNIERDNAAPFDAKGFLSNESEQYFLLKSAKIAFVNAYEYAYFKKLDTVSCNELTELDAAAWEDGISHVKPGTDHKNTDVALIVIADKVGDDVRSSIDSYKHSKNYMLGLHGFSNYRLVVIESSTGTFLTNRRGRDLRDFVQRIMSGT